MANLNDTVELFSDASIDDELGQDYKQNSDPKTECRLTRQNAFKYDTRKETFFVERNPKFIP